jgi:hypothetical protein
MAKTTAQYWNVLADPHRDRWHALAGTDGLIEQLTLAVDEQSGDYTRLTRFHAGVIAGRLYDAAFDLWLEAGHYASRPPGEVHGPFWTETTCLVLECSYPSQAVSLDP